MSFYANFVFRGITAFGQLCLIWFVGRFVGASALGLMVLNLACITLLSVLVNLGHNIATMRQFALDPHSQKSYRLLFRSAITVALISFVASTFLAISSNEFFDLVALDFAERKVSQLYIYCIFPASMTLLLSGFLKGVGQASAAILSDIGVVSFSSVVLLLIYSSISGGREVTDSMAAYAIIGSYWLVFFASLANFFRGLPRLGNNKHSMGIAEGEWGLHCRTAARLLVVNLAEIANATIPLIIIGSLVSNESLAGFRVAERVATLISFGLVVANITLPAAIGSAISTGNRQGIQDALKSGSKKACLVGIVIAIPLLLFPTYILSNLGVELINSIYILYILMFAQIVNMVTGPTLLTLKISEHTKFVAIWSGITSILYIAFLPISINYFGILGAAILSCMNIVTYNVVSVLYLNMAFGVLAIPFTRRKIK
ncbi:hypothetical protein IP81_16755 [Novosphingobium sp. AAP83]|nr:hypothetical protein IP81_16755 [Novosphingobium sp. AAP83]